MKILRLTAENVKRISVVDIIPKDDVVQITGPNGSGKTSVLDCIWWALGGSKAVEASKPVRDGEEKATIRLDLGDVIVTRVFSADGTTKIKVEDAASGAVYPSPQKMLDDLAAKFTFDPFAFARLAPKDQLDAMKRLVTLDVDVDSLDAQNRADYEKRADVNRRAKSLTERVNTLFVGIDPSVDVTLTDVSGLLNQMAEASGVNAALESERIRGERIVQRKESVKREIKDVDDEIQRLRLKRDGLVEQLVAIDEEEAALEPLGEPVDVRAIQRQIEDAQRDNATKELQLRQRESHRLAKADRDAAAKESDAITAAMDERSAQKAAAIAAAKMPVDGLGFGDGELTLRGIPFAQASDAEQLRTSVGVAMVMNPKLRVLRIRDGSLLDETSMSLLAEMAAERDYQVWIERVDTTGRVGIVMEDGTARVAALGESN